MLPDPLTVRIAPLVPLRDPSVAVTVCVVAAMVLVVNVSVAMPLALVGDVDAEKLPPLLLDQVTVLPDVATGLLFTSVSCAEIVTDVPAIGVVLLVLTTYLVAAPGT